MWELSLFHHLLTPAPVLDTFKEGILALAQEVTANGEKAALFDVQARELVSMKVSNTALIDERNVLLHERDSLAVLAALLKAKLGGHRHLHVVPNSSSFSAVTSKEKYLTTIEELGV